VKEKSSVIKLTFDVLTIYSYLIEEYERQVPFIFKPIQLICIPKDKEQIDYATGISNHLRSKGYRSEIDTRSRSLDAKIKNAEDRDIEFLLIVGPKEESNNAVAVRRNNTEIGLVSTDNLIKFIQENQDRN
jgi:threonyl-tRNA synthetase